MQKFISVYASKLSLNKISLETKLKAKLSREHFMPTKPLGLIGAAFGWGAKRHEAQFGPQALEDFGLVSFLQKNDPAIFWHMLKVSASYHPNKQLDYAERLIEVQAFTHRLAKEVDERQKNYFPIILGGDHSIAIGTWSGMAVSQKEALGLIWIDAHMDSHTPQTTPSQAIHGMPLAALLGYGEPTLVNLYAPGTKLNPQDVVLIGVRSFESEEAALLKQLNVKIYYMDEVKARGFDVVFQEALSKVTADTKGFGISIDIDSIDPILAPGTGAPEPDGLNDQDIAKMLRDVRNHPQFKALEIAEFDPTRDSENKTAKIIQKLVESVLNK